MWLINATLNNAHILFAIAAFLWLMAHLAYGPAE
ncbi:hypothetical protein C8K61_105247 [Pseudomonas sp. GV071]|jgi:hypothetical protein|nr:hypothetical protein C8K61_105247 [Pseudomonas sp. GV071]